MMPIRCRWSGCNLEIEATRLAYAARDAYLADPLHATVDADWLLSEELARELRGRIDSAKATISDPAYRPGGAYGHGLHHRGRP